MRVGGKRPFQPGPAAGAGISGDTGIGHSGVDPGRLKRFLQLVGKAVSRRQPIARHQAVAEAEEAGLGFRSGAEGEKNQQ